DNRKYYNIVDTSIGSYLNGYNNGAYNISYNKDGYVGTLTGTSFNQTYLRRETGTREGSASRSWGLLSNSESTFTSKPHLEYNFLPSLYESHPTYTNITITGSEWNGDM